MISILLQLLLFLRSFVLQRRNFTLISSRLIFIILFLLVFIFLSFANWVINFFLNSNRAPHFISMTVQSTSTFRLSPFLPLSAASAAFVHTEKNKITKQKKIFKGNSLRALFSFFFSHCCNNNKNNISFNSSSDDDEERRKK